MSFTTSAATAMLTALAKDPKTPDDGRPGRPPTDGQRDLYTQFVISFALGLGAFLAFCVLRPKWTELYAARRKQRNAASQLPELPDSFFGWIPVVYRITEEEVLHSAGLDAYVFLSFFKFAIRLLFSVCIFALTIILPLHYANTGKYGVPGWDDIVPPENGTTSSLGKGKKDKDELFDSPYLWMYVVFPYIFTGLAFYFLLQETTKIIRTRQSYLGNQTSTTDRTVRLSGIPTELKSEDEIKKFVEGLRVGKVETVTLCRKWEELDRLIDERMEILRSLERAWTKHIGYKRRHDERRQDGDILPLTYQPPLDEDHERSRLLAGVEQPHYISDYTNERPRVRVWYGLFKLQHRSIDAIDYYEERLRKINEQILAAREKEYPPTSVAFVTMESIAASQMLVQATIDPHPMQMFARLAPAPADVIWKNTYLSRPRRMFQSWSISIMIGFLTIFWSVLLLPIASLLDLETLHKFLPGLADALSQHPILKSLVKTGLPTLAFSLLTIAVPYLYEFFGTASGFLGFWENLRDAFKDTETIAFALANSLEGLAPFYINLLVLQGLGLFPFRLLEFGSVALYPLRFMMASTPREYAELSTPPQFSYGLSIPQTILIFIICIVYSVFPSSWLICIFGLVYFSIGMFIYKYQLLYAMDHQQHSTGRAWPMICNRVFAGLVVFQLAMIGVLGLQQYVTRVLVLLPLLAFTVWFSYWFSGTYEPLMKFIALKSINRDQPDNSETSPSPLRQPFHHHPASIVTRCLSILEGAIWSYG
ncbi:hypothetical protein N7468_003998 [Penicillium chermesinum]|uniref:Uncharacterized protein n=1 Tax=Penicillium chermesinum TaxID=63820 RepID=A0A9W9TTX0_9EURO|nr:uncharacterized protein N7468_003998 [Penicillium chermesinum]KAJ5239379.1 hypothetical protein N7468_003998 [Penicillium chermesinum]